MQAFIPTKLLLQPASVCRPRSFRVPSPSPRSLATVWYDLGATQEILHQMRTRLSGGLPTIASPPRAESPSPSHRPAATPIRPSHGGKFIKASKGEGSAPSTASTGPSLPIATTSPKTETRKRKKRKSAKCTATSEMVSPPEKKKKVMLGLLTLRLRVPL